MQCVKELQCAVDRHSCHVVMPCRQLSVSVQHNLFPTSIYCMSMSFFRVNTLLGVFTHFWWYHRLHPPHRAIFWRLCSGILQIQCSVTPVSCTTAFGCLLRLGNGLTSPASRHLIRWSRISFCFHAHVDGRLYGNPKNARWAA